MTQAIPFMAPRMVGARFEGHAIPLELLKDLATLEEMILEVAKWRYLQDNQDRKRTPKGFTDGIGLKITGIEDGSAIPQISLFVESNQLFPPSNQHYFELARDSLIGAISAAEHDEPITQYLPESLLGFFDRIGRGLRDGECIEFAPKNTSRPARLTKASRRKLILASSQVQELTEEVTLRGAIPEADQGKMTFELEVINGPRVLAPINSQHMQTVKDAWVGYKQGVRVLLQGIGRYNRYDRLQSLESVEHLSLLDANDILARLDELRAVRNGWLDGKKGFAPSTTGLDWLANSFKSFYPDELPPPYLYPTAEGGIQAEWSINAHEISLDIDIDAKTGQWHTLNMLSEEESTQQLNLGDFAIWQWLIAQIEQLNGLSS
jgi:hypothetical protein